MIKVEVGNCYIFGPGIDGMFSVEKVDRILDSGLIITHFRGNAHQHRNAPEEVFAEVGCNCEKHWFYPEDLGLTMVEAKVKGEKLWTEKHKKFEKELYGIIK